MWMNDQRDAKLLALKMEEEDHKSENGATLMSWTRHDNRFSPKTSRMNTALLTA